MMAKPITCRETTYLVIGARDEPLSSSEIDALAEHLKTCSHCQVANKQFSQLFAQLDTLLARDVKP